MTNNLLEQIEKAGLVGRGGAGFNTAMKWKYSGKIKYLICNASEGELGLFKDIYILENHLKEVMEGMRIVMDHFGTKEAYFNFNENYYTKLKNEVDSAVEEYQKKGYTFNIFKEHPSYIGGEETALINAIEGRRVEPRLKPPFPGEKGLFGEPTLVHNVETLFNIYHVVNNSFENKRFYCISGEIDNKGVYHLPDDWNIYQVLKKTNNIPEFDYFVQIGGSASGVVLNSKQLEEYTMMGAGSIEVYKATITPYEMFKRWFDFYEEESCGKCTPCRLGTYQLSQMIDKEQAIPLQEILEIIDTMEKTSFCALGKSIATPVKSYLRNVLKIRLTSTPMFICVPHTD